MRQCIYCGRQVEEDDRFCVWCGKPLPEEGGESAEETVKVRPASAAGRKQGRQSQPQPDAPITLSGSAAGREQGRQSQPQPDAPVVLPGSAAGREQGRQSQPQPDAPVVLPGSASGRKQDPGPGSSGGSRAASGQYAARQQDSYIREGGAGGSDGGPANRKMILVMCLVCLILVSVFGALLLLPHKKNGDTSSENMIAIVPGDVEEISGSAVQEQAAPETGTEESVAQTPQDQQAPEAGENMEQERKAREEAEQRAREEAERKAREEAEQKAREEAERKAREEAEQKAREEEERKEEQERKAKEEAEQKAREEEERKAAEAETRPEATDSSYVLGESSSRYYSYDELNQLDDNTLQMAINEIYARHGRRFTTPSLQAYFDSKTWYNGTIPPEEFDGNEGVYFNSYETSNRELMAQIRAERAAAAAPAEPVGDGGETP